MKSQTLAYWITTGLTAAFLLSSGAGELARPQPLMEGMARLGYPPYVVTILGVWKVLGAIAVLMPRTPRLKEWAYAGILFDLTGASVSHACRGEQGKVVIPLVILAIAMASWALRPIGRKL